MHLTSISKKLKKSKDKNMFMEKCYGSITSEHLKLSKFVLSLGRNLLRDGEHPKLSSKDQSEELINLLRMMPSLFGKILFTRIGNRNS